MAKSIFRLEQGGTGSDTANGAAANILGITASTSNAHQSVVVKEDGSGFEPAINVPTYTTTARDALTNVPTNFKIYNSTVASFQEYNGSSWSNIGGGGGGGSPGGSDTQVQFNDGGSFGGDAGFTYDKTTDSLTLAGNQTFSGSAKRIKGDLSNATRSTRLSFQTSTTDSNTLVQAIPSGTGTLSGFLAYGESDPDNSSYLQVHAEDSVHVGLNSGKSGTGTTQDLVFQIDGTTKAKVNAADGKFNVDTLTASEIVATDASKNLQTLPVASYPSLAELAYVKGVTSAIQTQLDTKQNTLTSANFGAFVNSLSAKTTLVDADLFSIADSADSNNAKEITFANLKAALGLISTVTVSGTTQAMAPFTRYIATNASQTVFTLPTTAAVGDVFEIIGSGAGGWKVNQNASQSTRFGSSVTTTGTGGSATSSSQYDSATIVCTTANTGFRITNAVSANIVIV